MKPKVLLLGPFREPTLNESNPWRDRARTLLGARFEVVDPVKETGSDLRNYLTELRSLVRRSDVVLRYFPQPTSTEDMMHLYAWVCPRPVVIFGPSLMDPRCISPGLMEHSDFLAADITSATNYLLATYGQPT